MTFVRLNPRYVARKLGRKLEGSFDPAKPTLDYAILHLLNTDQVGRAQEVLADPALRPGVGEDLVALVRGYLEKIHAEGEGFVRYQVEIPKHVWHRYAQRAREEHRRVRALLGEAIVAQDERIERSKAAHVAGAAELDELLRDQRELVTKLGRHIERLEKTPAGPAGGTDALRKTVDELKEHAQFHGIGLAAILTVMQAQKWIPKHLADRLRRERWLAE